MYTFGRCEMHIEDRTYRNRAWCDLDDSHRKHPAAMRRDQQARSLNLARKKNAGILAMPASISVLAMIT